MDLCNIALLKPQQSRIPIEDSFTYKQLPIPLFSKLILHLN